jgi:hypothetical protein
VLLVVVMPAVVAFLVVAATAMVRREHADDNDTERPRERERKRDRENVLPLLSFPC